MLKIELKVGSTPAREALVDELCDPYLPQPETTMAVDSRSRMQASAMRRASPAFALTHSSLSCAGAYLSRPNF